MFVGSRPFSSRNVNFSPLLVAFRLVICYAPARLWAPCRSVPLPTLLACLSVLQGSSYKPNNAHSLHPQITLFSLFRRPEAHTILWPQFLSWRGYIRFSLWRPRWANQSKRGLVFQCSPSLHRDTFRAAHLHGLFNRAEHCLTVSIIPPLTFHFFSFLFYLLSDGLDWPHRGRGGNGLGLASPLDAALLLPTNNKDDFVIYMCVVVAFFVPRIRGKWSAKLRTDKFCSRVSQISTSYTKGCKGLSRLD